MTDQFTNDGERKPEAEANIVMMYDIATDEMRPVTQQDVDRWQSMERAYGGTRYVLRRVLGYAPAPVPLTDWKSEAAVLGDIARYLDKVRP